MTWRPVASIPKRIHSEFRRLSQHINRVESRHTLSSTPIYTDDYSAKPGEYVLCNPQTKDITVQLPPSPSSGQRVAVKCLEFTSFDIIVDAGAKLVESVYPVKVDTNTTRWRGLDAYVEFSWSNVLNQWEIREQNKVLPYFEVWAATPITSNISSTPVHFTHVPDRFSPAPAIASFGSNVFTFNLHQVVDITWHLEWQYRLSANNQDVSALLDFTFTGLGDIPLIDDKMPFAHSRSGNFNQTRRDSELCEVHPGDTWGVVATKTGGNGNLWLIDMDIIFMVLAG